MKRRVMTLSNRLKILLKNKGLTQKDAAAIIGISPQSLNYIITNEITESKLSSKIAAALNVNPRWLIYGEGRTEEITGYEIPIINNLFTLEAYVKHASLQEEMTTYTLLDQDIGEKAFAYRVNKKILAICYPYRTTLSSSKYLLVDFTKNTVEICENSSGDDFFVIHSIVENCVEN